ncbi:MAG TPA: HD domain-containing protein [Aeromicrobium sp.]|nr:HD domain-containing protein [Aeromicrobium sp.]
MIGTREWLERTGGELSRKERLAHQAGAMAALTADLPSRFRLGRDAAGAGLRIESAPPSTDLARAATAWAESTHEPWLLRHSLRTWLFGSLLAQLDGVAADAEALYLAGLLHDVGLTADYRIPGGDLANPCRCFAAHGAHISEEKLLELGASPLLASEVAGAIGMHLNAKVGTGSGATAWGVNQGAALDVVGARAADLGTRLIGDVLSRQDRTGFAEQFLAAARAEKRDRPSARMASLLGVGMGTAMRLNPLNRL